MRRGRPSEREGGGIEPAGPGRARIPARISWAVEALAATPEDELLEIGCGPGIAVQLVAERLRGGRITALDRSAAALARTARRNAAHIASGKVVPMLGELADAGLERGRFDRIFAVNVNLFWTGATTEPDVVRRALAPGGTLQLFYEPPAGRAEEIAERAASLLTGRRFSVEEVRLEEVDGATGVRIVAATAAGLERRCLQGTIAASG